MTIDTIQLSTGSMMTVPALKRSLEKPPVTGIRAHFYALAAVALPTVIRCSVNDDITGVAFSPYIPFVLLSALLLGWRYAALVAATSAAIADMLFIDPRFQPLAGPTDVFGISIFLSSTVLIILLMEAARSAIEACVRFAPAAEGRTGIIFSLERGQALAAWHGSDEPLRLGPQKEVAEMMKDFLAQLELGQRLTDKYS